MCQTEADAHAQSFFRLCFQPHLVCYLLLQSDQISSSMTHTESMEHSEKETHETRKEEERTNTCATSQGTCLRCRRRPRRKRRPHLRPHPRRLHRPLPRPLSCEIFTVVNATISTRVQSLLFLRFHRFVQKPFKNCNADQVKTNLDMLKGISIDRASIMS